MSMNLVVQDGVVKSLALKYDSQSRPELRFTLEQRDGEFCLWLPCCASGAAAERLASELEDGQHVILSSAKLCYRKRSTKLGDQSRMEILVWSIERLSDSAHDERTEMGERHSSAVEIVSPGGAGAAALPKKGKPRYPKWKPEPSHQN
jgi:hypothetical protein